jgi:hypothetical protein
MSNRKKKYKKKISSTVKEHIMTFRVSGNDFLFLQSLKDDGMAISDYIRTTMRATPRYQAFVKLMKGLPKLSDDMVVDKYGRIVRADKKPDEIPETPEKKDSELPEGFGI